MDDGTAYAREKTASIGVSSAEELWDGDDLDGPTLHTRNCNDSWSENKEKITPRQPWISTPAEMDALGYSHVKMEPRSPLGGRTRRRSTTGISSIASSVISELTPLNNTTTSSQEPPTPPPLTRQPSWIADLIKTGPFSEPMMFPYYIPTGFSIVNGGRSSRRSTIAASSSSISTSASHFACPTKRLSMASRRRSFSPFPCPTMASRRRSLSPFPSHVPRLRRSTIAMSSIASPSTSLDSRGRRNDQLLQLLEGLSLSDQVDFHNRHACRHRRPSIITSSRRRSLSPLAPHYNSRSRRSSIAVASFASSTSFDSEALDSSQPHVQKDSKKLLQFLEGMSIDDQIEFLYGGNNNKVAFQQRRHPPSRHRPEQQPRPSKRYPPELMKELALACLVRSTNLLWIRSRMCRAKAKRILLKPVMKELVQKTRRLDR